MRKLGFKKRGRERENIKPFKKQLQALAACRMEISAWDDPKVMAPIPLRWPVSYTQWSSEGLPSIILKNAWQGCQAGGKLYHHKRLELPHG